MFETRTNHESALVNTDLLAEATKARAEARQMRAEVERVRAEIRATRRENLELRTALAAHRDTAVPTSSGCEMELTAGTSIGPRRHFERSRGR